MISIVKTEKTMRYIVYNDQVMFNTKRMQMTCESNRIIQ